MQGRIEFVSLRTGRSPPVAPHPASWRRSYVRLQNRDAILEWTSTTLTSYARRRTEGHAPACPSDWRCPFGRGGPQPSPGGCPAWTAQAMLAPWLRPRLCRGVREWPFLIEIHAGCWCYTRSWPGRVRVAGHAVFTEGEYMVSCRVDGLAFILAAVTEEGEKT